MSDSTHSRWKDLVYLCLKHHDHLEPFDIPDKEFSSVSEGELIPLASSHHVYYDDNRLSVCLSSAMLARFVKEELTFEGDDEPSDDEVRECLGARFSALLFSMFSQLGVHFPTFPIDITDEFERLAPSKAHIPPRPPSPDSDAPLDSDASLRELYAVYVSDLVVLEGSTPGGDWAHFRCAASQLQGYIEDMSSIMPCQRSRQMAPMCFAHPAIFECLGSHGFEKMTSLDVLLWKLEGFLGRKAHEFFGVQETSAWLERIRKTHPALVEELIPHRFTLSKIAEVLRMLLEEGIPIIDMVSILETIGEKALECYDTPFIVEAVRLVTRRRWLSQLTAPREPLMVATLAPDVEDWFHERQYERAVAGDLAVNTVEGKRLLDMLKGYVFLFDRSLRPILLVSQPIRRYIWEYMSPYMPEIMVFSFVEFGAADYKVIQQVHFPSVDFEDFVHSLATEGDLSKSTEDDLPAAYAERSDFVPRHPGPPGHEPSSHSSFSESEPDDEEPVGRGLLGRARRRVRRLGQQILKRIEEN